jgi:5-methylphenazine-1-carboxylate 1-monooxygenase
VDSIRQQRHPHVLIAPGQGWCGGREILDNGADWHVVADDGTTVVDPRYLLRTDDGALVYLQTCGYRHGPPEVMARLAGGEEVDPAE